MLGREELIAAAKKLWGEPTSKKPHEWRFGTNGSKRINLIDLVWSDYEPPGDKGGILKLCQMAGIKPNGRDQNANAEVRIEYDYRDEKSQLLFQVVKFPNRPKPDRFRQRRPNGADFIWNLEGVRRVLYRLPELIKSDGIVFVVEGEKDADNVAKLGLTATCNPGGAGKWREEYSTFLADRDVVILPDNDEAGRNHARDVKNALEQDAKSVRILELPELGDKEDVSNWIARGGTREKLEELLREPAVPPHKPTPPETEELPDDVVLDDFYAFLPKHWYLYVPTQTLWPPATINSRLPKIEGRKATRHLDKYRAVSQMIWAPGREQIVRNQHLIEGGWIDKKGAIVFNQYRQPALFGGDPEQAGPWLDLFKKLYPKIEEHEHMLNVLAFKLQHPDVKINHALVLGGGMRIGKDTLLLPIKRALGSWNCVEARPATIMSNFNGYMRSVLLLINETRDLGDVKKYQFYDHMKDVIVSPPETVLVNDKYEKGVHVANVCLVIMTTNHRTDGLYLPPGDGRHFPVWSEIEKEDHHPDFFTAHYDWLNSGGDAHVAAYLRDRDVSGFRHGAPPPQTALFREIVDASMPVQTGWLQDIFADWNPAVFIIQSIITRAETSKNFELKNWLENPGNRKTIPHRLKECGYAIVENPAAHSDGRWTVSGTKQFVYGNMKLSAKERLQKASELR